MRKYIVMGDNIISLITYIILVKNIKEICGKYS